MTANTPILALPYPLPADTVDVPRDVQALATKLDGIVPNMRIIAGGVTGAGAITRGGGFTVAHTGTGKYDININPPTPSAFIAGVAISDLGQNTMHVVFSDVDSVAFQNLDTVGVGTDAPFNFIAAFAP
jgi:hypothetical protein